MNKVTIETGNGFALVALGVLAAAVVLASFARVRLPIIGNERTAFFALLVIGLAMCMQGMQFERYGWLHPASIAGIVIGALALVLAAGVIFRLRLPLIADDRAAVLALGAVMVLKVLIAAGRTLVAVAGR